MEKYPDLKFKVEPKKDTEVYLGFWESAKYYKELREYLDRFFYNLYPEIKFLKKNKRKTKVIQKKEIEKFVNGFYSKNEKEFKLQAQKAQKEWNKNKNKFFKLTNGIFKKQKWSKGKYVGYLTIWGTFPRFLNDNTFCFPDKTRKKQFVLAVSLHEMMHFIFYEYAIKKHAKLFKKLNTEQGVFWELAEIFNAVMHKTELVKIHGNKNYLVYPQHKKILPYFVKLWKDNKDIDIWILEAFKHLKNKK